MDQMVSEYRALHASVIKLWGAPERAMGGNDVQDMIRFNEAIDQAMAESIHDDSARLETSRNLFLDILSHDLRNPLAAISLSARLVSSLGPLSARQTLLLSQIADSAERAGDSVTKLLDLTRARLGSGLPLIREDMGMGFIAHMLVDEARAAAPTREVELDILSDLNGNWDKARIGQVFSNLIGNAV